MKVMENQGARKSNYCKPLVAVLVLLAGVSLLILWFLPGRAGWLFRDLLGRSPAKLEFDGQRAFRDVEYQVALGPRIPGSEAHRKIQQWLLDELQESGWETQTQQTIFQGQPVSNIIGKMGDGKPWIIFGAHYDSRLFADFDPDPSKTLEPVPGANDGASGVAVLLEFSRLLPPLLNTRGAIKPELEATIWLVFFDAEDNGRIEGWDWILGSRAFVAGLQELPDMAIIVDMVGDKNLNIYQEENSDQRLKREIWDSAAQLGYGDFFIPYEKYAILDDHTPFLEAGIRAVDIIDFDYAFFHSTHDTPDKVSPQSLEIVGRTLLNWLITKIKP